MARPTGGGGGGGGVPVWFVVQQSATHGGRAPGIGRDVIRGPVTTGSSLYQALKAFVRAGTAEGPYSSRAKAQAELNKLGKGPHVNGPQITNQGVSGSAGGASSKACLIQFPSISLGVANVGGGCIFSKTAARALIGGGVIVVIALPLTFAGIALLAAAGFNRTGMAKTAAKAAAVVPGGEAAAAAVGVTQAGSAERKPRAPRHARTEPYQPRHASGERSRTRGYEGTHRRTEKHEGKHRK